MGLKPSAIQGKASLRGLERITYSKTGRNPPVRARAGFLLSASVPIRPIRVDPCSISAVNDCMRRRERISITIRADPCSISAMQGDARLRGLYRIISSKTISPRLDGAKLDCTGEGKFHFQIYHHPCQSVISVPIRVLFRLSRATRRIRVDPCSISAIQKDRKEDRDGNNRS